MSIEAYEKLESSLTQLLHNLRKNVTSSGYWPEANRGMSFDLLSRSLRPVYIWARAGLVTSLLFFACVFPYWHRRSIVRDGLTWISRTAPFKAVILFST